MRGCFITFEGGEGAGKSTQIQRLRHRLEERGERVLVTREPGGSPKAEEIRSFLLSGRAKALGPFAEALLFSAARIDHVDATIRPALQAGTHVLCDRFADSTRAYQGVLGRVDPALIRSLERVAVGDVRPDLTLVLDVPVEVGLERARARREAAGAAADRFEAEDPAFHQALRRAFLEIALDEPARCAVIDATEPPDAVAQAVERLVCTRLPRLEQALGTEPPRGTEPTGGSAPGASSENTRSRNARSPELSPHERSSQEAGPQPVDAHVA